jgi:cell fate regulator YaaT (PSP1 superfamily)
MPKVVGVRFKRAGKTYYFDPGDWEFKPGDALIVETARGIEFGTVAVASAPVAEEQIIAPLKQVLRPASEEDLRQVEENRRQEREAFLAARERLGSHNLDMRLVDVEYTFDRSKIVIYFTSEGRVDFRDLVRDLAGVFRTRIELRQVGVRDEAKMLGGLGSCGRELCCVTFLDDFAPVSIKMAKEQNLALNPTKISGLCGRLMCCLRYESDHYEESRSILPAPGSDIVTADGDSRVESVNVLKRTVSVNIEGKGVRTYPLEEVAIWKAGAPRPDAPARRAPEEEAAPDAWPTRSTRAARPTRPTGDSGHRAGSGMPLGAGGPARVPAKAPPPVAREMAGGESPAAEGQAGQTGGGRRRRRRRAQGSAPADAGRRQAAPDKPDGRAAGRDNTGRRAPSERGAGRGEGAAATGAGPGQTGMAATGHGGATGGAARTPPAGGSTRRRHRRRGHGPPKGGE